MRTWNYSEGLKKGEKWYIKIWKNKYISFHSNRNNITIKERNKVDSWKQIRINLKQVLHQSKSLDLNISSTKHIYTHTNRSSYARNASAERIETKQNRHYRRCCCDACVKIIVQFFYASLRHGTVYHEFFVPLSFCWLDCLLHRIYMAHKKKSLLKTHNWIKTP